jgi:hypothetical protein
MLQRQFWRWMALVSVLMLHPTGAFAANDDDGLDGLQERVQRNTWIKIRDDRRANITAWYKIEDGKDVRSFKLEAIMDSSLEKVAKTILVVDNLQHYFWECYESRQIKKISNTDLYAYLKVNVPNPVPDRDIVMQLHVTPYSKKRGYLQFDIKAAPDVVPLVPGLVRVPEYTFWVKLTPLSSDETKLEMEGTINPGGNIPAWAINFIMRNAPYTSILGMRRLAKVSSNKFEEPFPYRVIED